MKSKRMERQMNKELESADDPSVDLIRVNYAIIAPFL